MAASLSSIVVSALLALLSSELLQDSDDSIPVLPAPTTPTRPFTAIVHAFRQRVPKT